MNIKCSNKAKASDGAHLLIFLAWLLYTVSYLGKLNYSANITQIVNYYQISKTQYKFVYREEVEMRVCLILIDN